MKDTQPRKPRVVRSSNTAILQSQAKIAQEKISKIINPLILELYNKKDLRSLSSAEFTESEQLKFNALINIDSLDMITPESVHAALQFSIPSKVKESYSNMVADFVSAIGREPSTEENRNLQAVIYAEYFNS